MSMTRILLPIDPPLLEKVEAYRLAQNIPARTEAIRLLLERGLSQTETPLLDRVLGLLRRMRPELEKQGVLSAGVFGSLARGAARPDSDIDIGLRLDPKAELSAFDFVGIILAIEQRVQAECGRKADVADMNMLYPHVAPSALRDFIPAFAAQQQGQGDASR